ncbi:MAG TPA: rhodanese-like domain-containing protein [Chitinophaga sp.]|uniref:rhodanese-like domain-containing protein n=1 Tax=Chitinophaga sp. TaxID=1869181 RepID=UPI002CD64C7C|nr:rhodanese-like domain-containing protein [Chitinophaga sp.]HVI46627.1 rhodanese-like domain-containing protein [Chitinophaga sp.]
MHKMLLAAAALLVSGSLYAQQQVEDAEAFAKDIQKPGVQVFDVRTAAEFKTGHLPDALQADYNKKEEFIERVKYLDKQRPVYVYCLAGGRSNAAAKWMRENGFQDVVELKGGINAWKQAGKALDGVEDSQPQMTMEAYNKATNAKGAVLVDVGAAWCPPCRKLEPALKKYLQDHKDITLFKVDGGRDQDVMKAISVKSLPTLILYKDGKEVWRKHEL